jgi:SAM-dependent methyltransferase
MSKALLLRNTALGLAARTTADFSLTPIDELSAAFTDAVQTAVSEAQSVIVLGASTPGLASQIMAAARAARKPITIVESDERLLRAHLPQGMDEHQDPRIAVVHTDPADLRIDPHVADEAVKDAKPRNYAEYRMLAARITEHGAAAPLIPDSSTDLVVVDMLANRLNSSDTAKVLAEAFRVLRRGGRLMLTVLAGDEPIVPGTKVNFDSWYPTRLPLESEPAAELGLAGFHGMTYHYSVGRPVHMIKGVEVRAFLVDAFKGKQGICLDQGHAVIYRGPWSAVLDDDGHRYERGERAAVCTKTYALLTRAPYREQFIGLPAYLPINAELAPLFVCDTPSRRDPKVTKGLVSVVDAKRVSAGCCDTPQSTTAPITDGGAACCT